MSYLPMAGVLETITDIAEDPALPEVITLSKEIYKIESAGMTARAAGEKGIGLRKIVTPLRAYLQIRKNAWMIPVGIGLIIGIPFMLGYRVHVRRKKR